MFKKLIVPSLIGILAASSVLGATFVIEGNIISKTNKETMLGERTSNFWNSVGTYLKTTNPSGYDILINGTSKYLNFNTLSGTTGYGFRDNGGTMEVKNSGGSWGAFAAGASSGANYSLWDYLKVGRTATTTIYGDNTTSTFSGGVQTTLLNITSNTATSTFANGIDLSNGCFAIDGVCLATGGSGDAIIANGIGQFPNNTAYLTATSTETLSNKTGNISQWTNNTAYITATSSETLTGKSGDISMWTNNSNYAVLTNGIGQFTNNTAYITATSTETLTNKLGTIGMWSNNTGYVTASSSIDFTNKTGNISQWTNDSGYAVVANGIGQFANNTGYMTASSSNALTNKTGDISQWTNNTAYLTATSTPYYPAFTYTTSTAWAGTSTIPLGPAFTAETWSGVKCFTDAGTLNVSFNDGTNYMNMFNASSTVGTVGLITNNTFTSSEKRYVDIGTPATSPTRISCTVSKIAQ